MQIQDQPMSSATRALLAKQLTIARAVALQFPTVAAAQAAHFMQAGRFAPGAGAHFINTANFATDILPDGQVNPFSPLGWIYDGTSPTSQVVGLMYASNTKPSIGFAGPNDHWHQHFNLCTQMVGTRIIVPFPADTDITKAMCNSVHGQFATQTVWMVHAWVVPGWESPLGVFSHINPDLRCANYTFNTNPQGFCQGPGDANQ